MLAAASRRVALLSLTAVLFACGADDGSGVGGASDEGSTGGSSATSTAPESSTTDEGPTSGASAASGSDTSPSGTSPGGTSSSGTSLTGTDDGTTTDDESSADGSGSSTGLDHEGVLYVRPDGINSNPGTHDEPLRTIQWALSTAQGDPSIHTIRVAEGDYVSDYGNLEHIVMIDGVALVGGFRSDWGAHDPWTYVSSIVDHSDPAAATFDDPNRALEVPVEVTSSARIEGFRFAVRGGQYRAVAVVLGDVVLRRNHFVTVMDSAPFRADGVVIEMANPTLDGNLFDDPAGLSEGSSFTLHAIRMQGSDALLRNNIVNLADGAGVEMTAGMPTLEHNTIVTNRASVWMASGASPRLVGNLFQIPGHNSYCLYSQGVGTAPTAVLNNVFNCTTLFWTSHPLHSYETLVELEGGLFNAQDNVRALSAIVAPPDFDLSAASLCDVTVGAHDVAMIDEDFAGASRTAPHSMGAIEWDGACL